MSKPRWTWQWDALKFWNLGGGRRRRNAASHKNRVLRVETLNARMVLASDLAINNDAVISDPIAQEEYTAPLAPQQKITTEAAAAVNTKAAQYDLSRDGIVSPIDVLVFANYTLESTDATVQATEVVSMLDVNGDGQLSGRDVTQLIGYVERMNSLHARFETSELDASLEDVARLVRNAASNGAGRTEVASLAAVVGHTVTTATLLQPEGEATQEACDDWLTGIYVLEYDIQEAEDSLAEAEENLETIQEELDANDSTGFETYEDYLAYRDSLIGERDALVDGIADLQVLIDDAYVVLADAQAWYDENCTGTPTPTPPTPT
ncbi:MAG TPA: dockerin type I domain-containing protein, partial [Pirellulaceae bacterium]|nr:dockerin type I domain-containing protein [Pirellulaceae bacterium]